MKFWQNKQRPCPACTPGEQGQEARQVDSRTDCKNCGGTGNPQPQEGFKVDPFTLEMMADHRDTLARERGYLSRAVVLEADSKLESVEVIR